MEDIETGKSVIPGLNSNLIKSQPSVALIDADQITGSFQRREVIGGAGFRVGNTQVVEIELGPVAAGVLSASVVTTTLIPPLKTIPDPLVTVYVDNDNDLDYIWPNGSSLSNATRPAVSVVHDHDRGAFDNGQYVFVISVENRSAGDQTYYIKLRYLVPIAGS